MIEPKTERDHQQEAVANADPQTKRRATWMEVIAVLCIGVLPMTTQAVTGLIFNLTSSDWKALYDALRLFGPSCCIIFAVTYLIARSGERFASFGIGKPEWIDLLWGIVACAGALSIWRIIDWLRPHYQVGASAPFQPLVRSAADVAVLAIGLGASAVAEELVCRAYLVTRFLQLLGSTSLAVLLPAALYASFHLQHDLFGIACIFASGVFFGVLFLVVRRALPLALGHWLYNLVQLAVTP